MFQFSCRFACYHIITSQTAYRKNTCMLCASLCCWPCLFLQHLRCRSLWIIRKTDDRWIPLHYVNISLPNIIKIDPCKFELYRFKVGSLFLRHSVVNSHTGQQSSLPHVWLSMIMNSEQVRMSYKVTAVINYLVCEIEWLICFNWQ